VLPLQQLFGLLLAFLTMDVSEFPQSVLGEKGWFACCELQTWYGPSPRCLVAPAGIPGGAPGIVRNLR
jgi:hypothetical protein